MKKTVLLALLGIMIMFSGVRCTSDGNTEKDVYVLYYFEGHAGDRAGLHSAYSYDLHSWHPLGERITAPELGEWGVFRDPCVIRTNDSLFHLIWTCGSTGYGYASSEDGAEWHNERFIKVAGPDMEYDFANVWAPELYLEGDSLYVLWSSTLKEDYVPPKDSAKWWTSVWNHRMYYHATTDFENFTPTRPFWDPGFNAIDGVVYQTDSLYYLFFKDERKSGKNVLMAESKSFTGPYENQKDVAYKLTEGAIPVSTDSAFVLYYDYYHEYNGYRYITTRDMKTWSDEVLPEKVGFDDVFRHGSIVKITEDELAVMKEKLK